MLVRVNCPDAASAPVIVVSLQNRIVEDGLPAPTGRNVVDDPTVLKAAIRNSQRQVALFKNRHTPKIAQTIMGVKFGACIYRELARNELQSAQLFERA